jgi:hypothetical protein
MTQKVGWRRLTIAVHTLATMALLLYTIGAPHEHGG